MVMVGYRMVDYWLIHGSCQEWWIMVDNGWLRMVDNG